ncbi:MAG: phosphosulfolactate synthase [Geminicoccaceae bacterium]|nr:phosphosulfolactate synthase [Geminicoccaceae bacterium]
MSSAPFGFLDLPPTRSTAKPRRSGMTMIADWGMTVGAVDGLMALAGAYADFAKIVTGTARLYPPDQLAAKLDLYRRHAVRPFIGGQFAEYVLANHGRKALGRFFTEATRLGFATIEISDNCLPIDDQERASLVREATDAGLAVMGEVGSKDEKTDVARLIAQAHVCFEAGAELVLIEAAELVEDGAIATSMLRRITAELDMRRVMIELPGPWISGTTLSMVEDLKKLLILELGPEVNLANVKPEELLATEALRCGLGVVGPKERTPRE